MSDTAHAHTTSADIHQLYPVGGPATALTDAQLLALYAPADPAGTTVRANFISSLDGSATAAGVSGGLGAPADKRVFDLLRQRCDVLLIGAGTVRDEGYGALRLDDEAVRWRLANGLAAQPTFAIITGRLNLEADSDIFTKAPVRPILLTAASADAGRREALSRVADVIDCGDSSVDAATMIAALSDRGFREIHCEGGPSILGGLIETDLLDGLCLTLSPSLEGGAGQRISHLAEGAEPFELRGMTLATVLLAGNMMLTQYRRDRG
ncbi:MAG: hypothetical protein JWQ43_963 [Glaciihabitans sp.]|nr:hypothetical protein [Glaciihabitans sp.]